MFGRKKVLVDFIDMNKSFLKGQCFRDVLTKLSTAPPLSKASKACPPLLKTRSSVIENTNQPLLKTRASVAESTFRYRKQSIVKGGFI